MTDVALTPAERRRLSAQWTRDRFGAAATPSLAADAEAFVDGLLDFEQGEVPPGPGAVDVGGVQVAPPSLDHALQATTSLPPRDVWDGAEAAVAITHDVDAFHGLSFFGVRAAGWGYNVARALARRDVQSARWTARRAAAWTRWWLRREDPIADLGHWQRIEAEHGVRSTFYFLALERALSREGRLYAIDDPAVVRALHALRDGGWEVGLHAARFESDTAAGLATQRVRLEAALGAPVDSIRYHYLTARFPAAWRDMHDAGFRVSSNVGFHPPWQGFRTGTAWPYRPLAHHDVPIWEAPMGLMDVCQGVARDQLLPAFDRLLKMAREVGGLLVINFHTNYVADVDAPNVHAQYRAILGRIRDAREAGHVACYPLGEAVSRVAGAPPASP